MTIKLFMAYSFLLAAALSAQTAEQYASSVTAEHWIPSWNNCRHVVSCNAMNKGIMACLIFAAAATTASDAASPTAGALNSTRDSLGLLGLRLVPAKVTLSVIVIDQIHRPSEN